MSNSIKEEAQEQAEQAYKIFLKFMKWLSYGAVAIMLVVASCNFGVDGTGGKYDPDPALQDEYRSRMGIT
jgi:hypothetical protein